MKGPAGYGRYDDDPAYVGCPWARSDMSPCIARDGAAALSPDADPVCVGCANDPAFLMQDLAAEYPPAAGIPSAGEPVELAALFASAVREATEPPEQEVPR